MENRISRSILDFATMMELFQEYNVEFVSSTERKDKLTQEEVFVHGYSGYVGYTQQSCGV